MRKLSSRYIKKITELEGGKFCDKHKTPYTKTFNRFLKKFVLVCRYCSSNT